MILRLLLLCSSIVNPVKSGIFEFLFGDRPKHNSYESVYGQNSELPYAYYYPYYFYPQQADYSQTQQEQLQHEYSQMLQQQGVQTPNIQFVPVPAETYYSMVNSGKDPVTLFNNPHQYEAQQPQQTVQMERPSYEHFLTPNFVMPKMENFKQIEVPASSQNPHELVDSISEGHSFGSLPRPPVATIMIKESPSHISSRSTEPLINSANSSNVQGPVPSALSRSLISSGSSSSSNNMPVDVLALLQHAHAMHLIGDKDNFQVSGCGWDPAQRQCTDIFGLCKGGCNDFTISLTAQFRDCRCVPWGYAALTQIVGRRKR